MDFIYSNALDHSYDPRHCLDSWMRCLVRDGICILHWGPGHNNVAGSPECSKADCFQASLKEYHSMIKETFEILADPEAMQMLQDSLADIRAGRTHDHEDVRRELA